MILERYGIKIDIPPAQFGNEYDIQLQGMLAKLNDLERPRKTPVTKLEQKVKDIMQTIKGILQMRANNK